MAQEAVQLHGYSQTKLPGQICSSDNAHVHIGRGGEEGKAKFFLLPINPQLFYPSG